MGARDRHGEGLKEAEGVRTSVLITVHLLGCKVTTGDINTSLH